MKKREDRLIDGPKIQDKAIQAVQRDATGTVQFTSGSKVGSPSITGITDTGTVTKTLTTTLTANDQILFQKWIVNAGIQAKTITLNTIAGGATGAQTTLNTSTSTTKTFSNSNTNETISFQAVMKFTGVTAVDTPFTAGFTAWKEARQGLAF